MIKSLSVGAGLLVLIPLLLAFSLQEEKKTEEAAKAVETMSAMTWLAGTWKGPMWGGEFEAYYTTPEGGRIISHSRLSNNGKESFYEFEVFEIMGKDLVLQPFPGGKRAHGFRLTEYDAKARKATFENPKKDYPTRIVYHRSAENRLVITLDDPHGTTKKVEVFDLKK